MREQGLFRREAIQAKRSDMLGPIQAAAPLSGWVFVAFALVLAGAIIVFLLFGHYTRRAHVSGSLVPSRGLLALDASLNGRVSRVWVDEGQAVRSGQPLLTLTAQTDSPGVGDVHAVIAQRLKAQQRRLASDRSVLRATMDARRKELAEQVRLYLAQRQQVREQLALVRQRVASDRALLVRIEPLGRKGFVSAIQIERQRAQVLQGRVQQRELSRQVLALSQQIHTAQRKIKQLPLDQTTQENALARQRAILDQQLARNQGQSTLVLRSPADGTVTSLLVNPGQTVRAGEAVLSVLPAGAKLEAQLLVPSRAAGFLDPGQRVVLRYRAYPYQKFGQYYGRIAVVPRSALTPVEVSALMGFQSPIPLYRVRVKLDQQNIRAYGKTQALKPGMALDADILMDRRSLLEWVFEPLYGMRRQLTTSAGDSHG